MYGGPAVLNLLWKHLWLEWLCIWHLNSFWSSGSFTRFNSVSGLYLVAVMTEVWPWNSNMKSERNKSKLNPSIVCCHSGQNHQFSHLISKNEKIKI